MDIEYSMDYYSLFREKKNLTLVPLLEERVLGIRFSMVFDGFTENYSLIYLFNTI